MKIADFFGRRILIFALLGVIWVLPARAQVMVTQADSDRMMGEHQETARRALTEAALQKLQEGTTLDVFEMGLLARQGLALDQVNPLLQAYAAAPWRGAMFYIHDIMSVYLDAYANLTPATRLAIRHSLKVLPIYRGDTENHYLMYYTGLYLAAQTWPEDSGAEWFNGKPASRNMREAREYIQSWMHLTATQGQGEFDSPNYITVYLSALFTLYNHCEEPVFRQQVRKILDWLLADFAVEYLKGSYCGGTSRLYPDQVVDPWAAPSTNWGWLLFGDTRPSFGAGTVPALWSDYRLPVIIQNIATDRATPFAHFERKRVRNVMRYREGGEMNPPVYKTAYMTSSYCLGSLQGGLLQPIQQHTWDVTYVDGDKPNTRIFTLNPYYSGRELAMFFPEEEAWVVQQVARYSTFYAHRDKWVGGSPYERTFQHRNAIIVLYDMPEDAPFREMDGFFPKSLDRREVDASGWIFCRGGETYIAVYPLKPYHWIDEEINWRLRSMEGRNGVVMEVGQAGQYPSFEAFKKRILENKLDVTEFDSSLTVHYATSQGERLTFTYPDKRELNGETYDLSAMPLFKGPYLQGDGRTQTLTLTHGNKSYTIDFGAD